MAVLHLCGTVAELAGHVNPKRPIAELGVCIECDEGVNGVDLGARAVPKWGSDIAVSKAVWHLRGTIAELAKHMNPKRPIAEPRSN